MPAIRIRSKSRQPAISDKSISIFTHINISRRDMSFDSDGFIYVEFYAINSCKAFIMLNKWLWFFKMSRES